MEWNVAINRQMLSAALNAFGLDGAINQKRAKFEQDAATFYDLRFRQQNNGIVVG